MKTKIRFLKVKIRSLMAEARIIRHEESRARGALRVALCDHRRGIVRTAARHNMLAYGFLRGRRYDQLERLAKSKPDWKEVDALVRRFGVCCDYNTETRREFEKRSADQAERFVNWQAIAALIAA